MTVDILNSRTKADFFLFVDASLHLVVSARAVCHTYSHTHTLTHSHTTWLRGSERTRRRWVTLRFLRFDDLLGHSRFQISCRVDRLGSAGAFLVTRGCGECSFLLVVVVVVLLDSGTQRIRHLRGGGRPRCNDCRRRFGGQCGRGR